MRCGTITKGEIDIALMGIGNDKALRSDGLSEVFYKSSSIVKDVVYADVAKFFSSRKISTISYALHVCPGR